MQKLSIIRFKPKPGCLDEFAANLSAYNETKHRVFHLMKSGDELHAIVIRDADILAKMPPMALNSSMASGIFYRSLTL
jgi:hypothetical protein